MSIKKIIPTVKHLEGMKKAIKHFGSQKLIAEILDVTPSNVNGWATGKQIIPLEHALTIATIYPSALPILLLRPDLEKISKYL